MANRHGNSPGGDQPNNNLNNQIPGIPNPMPNIMNQGQIPLQPIPNAYSPPNINMIGNQLSPIYPNMSPITASPYPVMPQKTQFPPINQAPRLQQQGSPFTISSQQSPLASSPLQSNQQKKNGPTKKQPEGVETNLTNLGCEKILFLCKIRSKSFIDRLQKFQQQSHLIFSEKAIIAIALAINYRMKEAVKQSVVYTQKRRLTLIPNNVYYTDFPVAQFAMLEAERRILTSGASVKLLKTPSSSFIDPFNFGFQGPSISSQSSSFFQPNQNQPQLNNDDFNFFNFPMNSSKIDDDLDATFNISKPSSGSNAPESSTTTILERFKNDAFSGMASRVYGKKRDQFTDLIVDRDENQQTIDQAPLKKLLPVTEKNPNVVIEDVHQYVESCNVISTKTIKSRQMFNLQFRKVLNNLKKNPPPS